ncbi:DUF2252 domain-containing protein [Kribbella sp. NPDC048915]|uniref:DUF2252 domain-containing protein n=1 Tax=Kribbella sp. NPDC048915 TaxID=3155148 RepID=UPI00341053FE
MPRSALSRGALPRIGLSRADRVALGKSVRELVPLESHAEFEPGPRDPIGLLLEQERTRVPELVPIRHGRMLTSPFAFYRGAALPMAADLATTPTSGLRVQLCGDAHLMNFGAFASPERHLVFSVNDFDETLPGPFEWDVKRLAASFAVAGRENGFDQKQRRKVVLASVESYRAAMQDFATRPFLDVWYAHFDVEDAIREFRSSVHPRGVKSLEKMVAKAHTHDNLQAFSKLTTVVDGRRRIVHSPPLIEPLEDIFPADQRTAVEDAVRETLNTYRHTLQSDRRHLLDHFTLTQVARKVVGVGSVGTRCWIVLMECGDGTEPLFLQAKEAGESVLCRYVGRSEYRNQGERVVAGQHLIQAQSDIFLGWTQLLEDGVERDYYVRQLKDWKFSADVERSTPKGLRIYAGMCGWTLARAHARSGDRLALAGYLGSSDRFAHALADFAEMYADQNERDYDAWKAAVNAGRLQVVVGA